MASFNHSFCNNAAAKRAARRIGNFYDDVVAPCGLRSTQVSLLQQLDRLESPNLTALAAALVMDRSAMSHTLKPLEREGYVTFKSHTQDRRVKIVVITQEGCRKLEEANSLWQEAQFRFELSFGYDEAASLRATLDALAATDFEKRKSKNAHLRSQIT